MSATWFVRNDDDQLGPLSPAALKQLVVQGKVTADSLIRQGEHGLWVPADKVKGLLGGDPGSKLQHDSALLVGASAAAGSSTKAAKGAQKTSSAKPAKPAAAAPAAKPAAAKPAAPKPAVRHSDSAIVTTPAAGTSAKERAGGSELLAGRRRKQNVLPLIITAVVVVLLLGATGIFVVASYVMQAAQEAVANLDNTLQNTPTHGFDANPPPGAGSSSDAPPKTGQAGPNLNETPEEYRQRVVRSIAQWRPALNRVGGTKKMKLRVDKVWLGDDAGRDVSPEFAPAGARKFVFVRMVITNAASNGFLEYAGWNTSDLADQAILIDDREAFCPLVSLDETRNERLPRTAIAPQEGVTDVLVFRAPKHEFEFLRLAVPFENGNHYGLQIDRGMLAATGPVSVPRAPPPRNDRPPDLEVDPSTEPFDEPVTKPEGDNPFKEEPPKPVRPQPPRRGPAPQPERLDDLP